MSAVMRLPLRSGRNLHKFSCFFIDICDSLWYDIRNMNECREGGAAPRRKERRGFDPFAFLPGICPCGRLLPRGTVMAHTQSKSSRVALGGIVAALCVTVMFLTGVLPALYIAAPMGAGMLMLILVEEVSVSWAWLTYTAVSLLSVIVTFDKEAALMFVLFFGYYPILRMYLERLKLKPARFAVKMTLFNVFIVLDYWLTVYVLGLPTFEDTMPYMYVILIVSGNLLFLMYDRLLSRMHWYYERVFVRKILGRRR